MTQKWWTLNSLKNGIKTMKKYSCGIDIGGSHISGGLVEMFSGEFITCSYQEMDINPLAEAADILSKWQTLILRIFDQNKDKTITKVGFAMPGPFDYENGIALFEGVPKYNSLYGINVKQKLSDSLFQATGKRILIEFINDATAFAKGEYGQGAAKGMKRVWVLTLGTGLGSTFLIDGNPVLTGEGMPNGGYLYNQPFQDGIADAYFSTRWFVNQYNAIATEKIDNVKALASLAKNNNQQANDIFVLFSKQLAAFLRPWLENTHSEGVVIGGGITKSWNHFSGDLKKYLPEFTVEKATLGGVAPIIGAVL